MGGAIAGCGGDNPVPADAGDTGVPVPDGGNRDAGRDAGPPRDGGRDGGDGGDASAILDAGACTGLTLCTVEGTSCSGDMLVTCAPNPDGCLVETATDCTTSSQICSPTGGTGGVAACVDPCAHVPPADRCDAASRACTGDTLDVCAMDAMGCFALTHTDCAASPGGSCDTSGTMAVCISTADPCGGLTSCGTATSRSCTDATHLDVCDANAAGCFIDMITTCPTGTVCDASSGTAACVDPCTLVDTCPAATYCDANAAVTCAPDANGCLVETSRSTCTTGPCSAGACTETCAPATGHVIDCASGTITGDTASGTTAIGGYTGTGCGGSSNYAGHEVVYRFANGHAARVTITSTRDAASGDFDLLVLDGGDGSIECTSASNCPAASRGTSATETVTFDVAAGDVRWVSYDLYGGTGTETTTFSLAISCVESVCGDSAIGAGETCDDGNTTNGDGCSSSCVIEPGSVCYGTPSVCGLADTCGNGIIEGAELCDDGGTASGDGCSATCQVEAGYGCTTGTPSVCTLTCGNGVLDTGETCDDGARPAVGGDGCSATCQIEAGYSCSGAPSVCAMLAANADCTTATPITATITLTGQNAAAGGASPTGTTCGSAGSPTLYYSVTIPAFTAVRVDMTPTGFDAVLKTEDTCGAAACNARVDVGFSGDPETTTITNSTAAPITRIVAANSFNTTVGTFDIAFTYVVAACGNGATDAGETCDDGNTVNGDGCSATCAVESGYLCTGTPSVCHAVAANATCAGAAVLDPNGSAMGDLGGGGTRPTGSGCTGASGPALWYSVTIPANSRTTLVATPTGTPSWDPVISTVASCGATGCTATRDVGGNGTAETLALTNATGAPVTRLFSVGAYSSTIFATFTLTASTAALPFASIPAACVDLSTATPLVLASGDTDDGATALTALPFAFSFFGTAETNYSVTTNGFLQLWPTATGTPSTAFSNATIPTATGPNGYIAPFWDDLDVVSLRAQTTGTAGSRVLVVEWTGTLVSDGGASARFQAMLYEGTNVVEMHYCSMTTTGTSTNVTGTSATIGTENATGSGGVLVSFNAAGAASTGTGYRIAP